MLSGKVPKPDPGAIPLRGDLAHIALAGKYFVPHYVVPIIYMAGDCGASIMAEKSETSPVVYCMPPGHAFEVLDFEGIWAWGCLGPEGPVGYVLAEELVDPNT